ncbi:DUF2726 domain-containing protein [Chromobacterium rhizoryzae]|uniref:DUF2726 domain-containing protein n=1 Tax=Chromobacterium rhizoryzae TaxID=1778675 RepID=UPI001D061446|nr:DUF2726 domain-containing protein [Chromobacterium rhizoryzae]
MNAIAQELRACLEERNLAGFLDGFEAMLRTEARPLDIRDITQRILPAILLELLQSRRIDAPCLVRLAQLIRSNVLLVVDNEVLVGINQQLPAAWRVVKDVGTPLPTPLMTYSDEPPRRSKRTAPSGLPASADTIPMRRIVLHSEYALGVVNVSDMMSFKKNVCASRQEREFLKAVRQYFPNLQAYPNVPLRNFIEVEGMVCRLSERHRSYVRAAQVDVLLCTQEEDPVVGFELDSAYHDAAEVVERDQLKDELFSLAGIPLFRIRADNASHVRAEDFYDLLIADAESLDKIRPRRLRPRRDHDTLVPASLQASVMMG